MRINRLLTAVGLLTALVSLSAGGRAPIIETATVDGIIHPVSSELTAAEATRSRISAFGIEYEGKTGLSAPFSWAA